MRDEDGKAQHLTASIERGPYILRKPISKEQLLQDGLSKDAYVTCVEFWNDNLYIGTSAAELIHYVLLPAPDDHGDAGDDQASFTYAFKVEVPFAEKADAATQVPGIQQILLLPGAGKACILCNGTISFFTLPELTPAFSSSSRPHNCTWVGGVDLNEDDSPASGSVTVMICQKSRVRLVAVGDRAQKVRDIELGGCLQAVRRSDIACVADANTYSLLDVVEQQRIPLFEISSFSEDELSHGSETPVGLKTAPAASNSRTDSPAPGARNNSQPRQSAARGQSSSPGPASSDGEQITTSSSPMRAVSPGKKQDELHLTPPQPGSGRAESPAKIPETGHVEAEKDGPGEQPAIDITPAERFKTLTPAIATRLRPNIISVNPNEFMLTTGTSYDDPGVGMFVNLDGEATRGTIRFSKYPEGICSDGKEVDLAQSDPSGGESEEPFVLALIDNAQDRHNVKTVEIKRWDIDPSDPNSEVHLLQVPCQRSTGLLQDAGRGVAGLREMGSTCDVALTEITEILGLSRLQPPNPRSKEGATALPGNSTDIKTRERAEAKFIRRLSSANARMLVWGHNSIYWIVRNPMIMKLDGSLREAVNLSRINAAGFIHRGLVERTLNSLRGREPLNELEFHSLNYIRQKGSIMLFIHLMHQSLGNDVVQERDGRVTEEALSEGQVDPRLLLLIVPGLHIEVIQGRQGIWVPKGLNDIMQELWKGKDSAQEPDSIGSSGEGILHLVKRYLFAWREKKGLASVSDEKEVFQTVDAALLHILLWLDSKTPQGPVKRGSIRAELNAVVDDGVDCFDRAVTLLEDYKRLYVLSRLYQGRKMYRQVLETWQRIIEGDEDHGGELVEGEMKVRRYLTGLHDQNLVEKYGTWLANRNPKLGVRVFADSNSKIKFQPEKVVEILKVGAPGAVKEFLEHLVFGLNMTTYVNDLINYYLDSVLSEIEHSSEARSTLLRSYETYRKLRPPKPTYSQFAANFAGDAYWWRNRLQLLQLLGGNQGPTSNYDVSNALSRIETFEQELIPEMIILNGRQGRHREALHLLTHGLGDFDTAIRYCLLGGSSTYAPLTGSLPQEFTPSRDEQELLFNQLVEEFLCIEDLNDRITQTSQLLEHFAGWVDIRQVLTLLPDSWSVEIVSRFLENAFRSIISERNETMITKALANTDNLAANYNLIEHREWRKPRFDGVG